jgi:hypothetical protein
VSIRFVNALLFALFVVSACRKKLELLPDDAKQVFRTDSTEMVGDTQIKKREYKFTIANRVYLCESRAFADSEIAAAAARTSVAERPTEKLTSPNSVFAVSGRSVWLKTGEQLVWCMFAGGKAEDVDAAMLPLTDLFRKKFQEVTK